MKATFPAFANLRNSSGPYTSMPSGKLSDGTVKIHCIPEEDLPPSPEQIAAIDFIRENPQAVRSAMFAAVEKAYEEMKEAYGFDPDDASHREWFPEVTEPEEYARVFDVGFLFLLDNALDGVAYVGLECGCTWDDEHGLGIVLHRDRVIAVGQADTAFNGWEAEDDMNRHASPEGDDGHSNGLNGRGKTTTNSVDGIEKSVEELSDFLEETAGFNAAAREQIEKVKRGKRWWEFWR